MRIIHICSYYIGNQLYRNLIKQLSKEELKQEVFIPVKNIDQVGINQLPSKIENVNYYYRPIIKKSDRFLYHFKIIKQEKKIKDDILETNAIDFIHAHTVFSDGGTAYRLYKEYGIDYIVNVRTTDINWYYKYAIHLRPFMYKILLNARKVVFISYAYKSNLLELLPDEISMKIKDRCIVIPNGIDEYWHNQRVVLRVPPKSRLKLLFIGSLNKNKNLLKVLEACAILRNQMEVSLDVIGSGPYEEELLQITKKLRLEAIVTYHGYIKDKSAIKEIMDNSDIFVMPSYKETFGLVYIEAMSRGLPVIYSNGQGIDGFFKQGKVGYSVDPSNTDTIVQAIKNVIEDYNLISENCIVQSKMFNWKSISEKYLKVYLED